MEQKKLAGSKASLWLAQQVEVAPKRAFGMVWPAAIAGYLGYQVPYIASRFLVAITGQASLKHLPHNTQHEIAFAQLMVALLFASTVLGIAGLWQVGGASVKRGVGQFARTGFLILIPFVGLLYALVVVTVIAPFGLTISVPLLVFYMALTPLHYVPAFRRWLARVSLAAAAARSMRELRAV